VLMEKCSSILKDFFQKRREQVFFCCQKGQHRLDSGSE
jgi:hypothetical protein